MTTKTSEGQQRRGARRRANGEGTITQRKDGRWEARISLEDGKRKVLYGKTQRAVRDKLIAARRQVQQGLPLPHERLTLGAWLTEWLETVARVSVHPSTFRAYLGYVNHRLLTHRTARQALTRVSPSDLDRLFADLRQAGLKPRTVEQIRAIIRRSLNVALKRSLVVRNVATLTDPPHVERNEAPALSSEEARRLLGALRAEPRYPLYAFALATGLRLGELLGLRWEDVDLDTGIVRVRQAAQRIAQETRFVPPKTNRSRRQIVIPASTIALLRSHRARQAEQRLALGSEWGDSGLIFTNDFGAPLVGTSVTNGFQRALARAGLPRMRFHDLRHGTASLLLAEGVNPRVVMERLGHSTIALTLGTYSHVIPALDQEAAMRLDRALGGN
jgi:integrase